MKKLIFVFFVFIFNFSNGQNKIKNDEFRDWQNPENFEKFGLKKVRSYSIKVNKKGKIKKDSLLLTEHNYDKSNSEIFGIFHYVRIYMHGNKSHLDFYNFKNNYNTDGLLLKKVSNPFIKVKKNKNEIEFNTHFEVYEYDALKRKTKETYYTESNTITIYKKDTSSYYKSIYSPKITEFEYDAKNRIIKQFASQDSATYFYKNYNQKEFKISKSAGYYEPKYLNQEWIYEGDNLTKYINYTYKKEVHTKKYYYYNSNNQLIKEIDSTGFYSAKPHLRLIREFEYRNNEKIESTTNFDWFDLKISSNELIKYDLQNRIKSINQESNYIENNNETIYEYLENSTIITRKNRKHKTTFKEVYQFDKKGLLMEKKEYFNEILTEFIKYYYE